MLNTKKSQAALEFLMTYGWAILVVLIVISALAYFGVLNPQRMLPSRCTMPTGFSCMDYVANQGADSVTLKVVNGMGSAVFIDALDLTSTGTHPSCTSAAAGTTLTNGQETTYVFTCADMSTMAGGDQKYRWEIVLRYHAADSTVAFSKTIKGELLTTLEP